MSTTARSSAPERSGRAVERSLTARAVRVRNAVLRQAAARLGLRMPEDGELAALRPDASLAEAIGWLEQAPPAHGVSVTGRAPPPFLLRAGCAAAVMLLGLMLSFGRVH